MLDVNISPNTRASCGTGQAFFSALMLIMIGIVEYFYIKVIDEIHT
jgi:hypothetical protein